MERKMDGSERTRRRKGDGKKVRGKWGRREKGKGGWKEEEERRKKRKGGILCSCDFSFRKTRGQMCI